MSGRAGLIIGAGIAVRGTLTENGPTAEVVDWIRQDLLPRLWGFGLKSVRPAKAGMNSG
jgi:hypothetical protein